ncbi:outer membrane beta-barrel protein [Mucilaginibacter boryungensis]|uniref:Outer membrane beta-barrel protein n=1 Tax=Mucilaginibacter boryungensis TaxID=768480 RepID=A0ABR9XNI6_9SPHI|nr:outer membrane beta-barrel protein [Mucilaginibacter boryungensis]MBE9668805.1 outer membrane beta-barrel protein [Mucilaginibacter boryungensis]
MKKTLYPILFILLVAFGTAFGQAPKRLIKAKVINTQNEPVEFATASVILNGPDSSIVKSTMTDKNGALEIPGIANGSYRIIISQLGLKHKVVHFNVTAQKPFVDLGTLTMENEVRNLNQVNISAEKAPVTIKKDTVEFNAGSYKTQKNDNVEQLFKKIPGVDVDKDGKITAQGQEVKKVLVDGKEFFGNDPKAVTKNLPADAIDKVQIIDDKTDKAKNTGIDDGERNKVMNVTLKADKKKGWFGNMAAARGNDNRYLGQFNMNHFDNKKQMSILSLSNNVNESGFSYEDLNNFAGGNAFSTFGSSDGSNSIYIGANGRANINNAFSGVNGGLITNHTAGLNYTDEYGKKGQLKFNTSFVTVISKNDISQTSNLQDVPNNLFTNQFSNGNNTSNSYRLSVNMEYKIDSLNNLVFKPNFSYSLKKNYSLLSSGTARQTADSVNNIRQLLDQTTHSPAYGGQFTLNHKFHNGKGSLNLYTTGNYSANNADYINQATTRYFVSSQPSTNTNQQASQDNNASFLTSTASFVRQLNKAKKLSLNISQTADIRKQNANQYTVDYNAVTGNYEIFNPLYSGNSDNRSHKYTTTAGLSKGGESYTLSVNAAVAEQGLHGISYANNVANNVSRDSWAFVPNASFSYRKKNGYNLYFNVGTNVSLPSATDLQTVFNNTNQLYIRQGNPDLTQSRSLNANVNYNYYDFKNNNYINFYINYNTTWNGFSTASTVDANGITTSKPINVDGNFNFSGGFNVGRPTKIKGLKYSFGSYSSVNRNINFINGNRNAVTRISPALNAGTSYDKEKLQLSLRFYGTYNNAVNSYQHVADRSYFTYSNNASASVLPVKGWRIFSDINQTLYRGQPASANTSYYLWNAGIEHYFLEKQNLTLSLNAFDLLNQNSGLQRSISTTGVITNNQTNTLGQYFYMKLVYKITKVGGENKNNGLIIMR